MKIKGQSLNSELLLATEAVNVLIKLYEQSLAH